MRTIAALLAALPLLAAAQSPPAQQPQAETTQPPAPAAPSQAAAAEAAPAAAAQPAAAPAPPSPALPPQAAPPQHAPPPQLAPPAPYPPPPQRAPPAGYAPGQMPPGYAKAPMTRDSWYIGFGVGGGDGRVWNDAASSSFSDLHSGGMTNASFNFKVGATLSPKLLLGGDISAIASTSAQGGVKTSLGISNLDAMATFFPMERGFFLRGGFGRSSVSLTREVSGLGKNEGSASGWNVAGGLGYAWWIGQHFNLTANLDGSRQWYGSSASLAIRDSAFWSLWLGFDWY